MPATDVPQPPGSLAAAKDWERLVLPEGVDSKDMQLCPLWYLDLIGRRTSRTNLLKCLLNLNREFGGTQETSLHPASLQNSDFQQENLKKNAQQPRSDRTILR